ncbi:MAG: TIGR01777 family oxidoreductase [Natronospirillum sp.]|uniref:TIGR01777 family oxidoreductase n=1 Tax=Natronospirillum sp. TaxID=2812955 RepID=UPI0025FD2642|nr:TIGR01777 family oxidoreductase [Natronospirillum sp.]MCH8552022.1 TIGR01777 family oxidoreductase [Natronospirillum sp.]
MRILICGGTGFLGQALAKRLLQDGHELVIHTRHPERHRSRGRLQAEWVADFEQIAAPVQAIVNLTGANLFTLPWTRRRKNDIWTSRIDTTNRLVAWIEAQTQKPEVLLNGSAVGFYGDREDTLLTEVSEPGSGWSTEMVMAWENAAIGAEKAGIRTVLLRTGPVLGEGGMLQPLQLAFKFGLGGSMGDGQFWFSWIHQADWVEAVRFLIRTPTLQGPVNLTSPNPVRYRDFALTLGQTLRRPVWLTPPGWALKPLLGERAELIMSSTRAMPQQLADAGFEWRYPDIGSALKAVCRR